MKLEVPMFRILPGAATQLNVPQRPKAVRIGAFFMKFTALLVAVSVAMLIALCSFAVVVPAQPTTPPTIAPATLTAEQEYTIREIILKDVNVPKEKSASETNGDSVPENVKLYALPSVIEQKVPKAQSHKFFIKDDDTIILVSPSD
jgi:hypothetical protein